MTGGAAHDERAGTGARLGRRAFLRRGPNDYSILIFAARITSPHFLISSRCSTASSSALLPIRSRPSEAARSATSGRRSASATSWLRRETIAAGVPARTTMPYQFTTTKPGSVSFAAGTSGRAALHATCIRHQREYQVCGRVRLRALFALPACRDQPQSGVVWRTPGIQARRRCAQKGGKARLDEERSAHFLLGIICRPRRLTCRVQLEYRRPIG